MMKTAIVTGTSSGFGKLASIALAKQGYYVFALMRPSSSDEALKWEITHYKLQQAIEIYRLNLEDETDVQQFINYVYEKAGAIHILVNNAGYAQGGFVESISFSQWKAQIEANVFITINMTKAVLPYMRRQRYGKIINISSVNGRLAMPAFAPYATSKFAIEGFSEALRSEMLPFNVYVSLIEPGSYPTEIWDRGFALMAKQHEQDYIMLEERIIELAKQSAASKRNPMEVAHLICKIASTKKPKLRYPVSFSDRLIVSIKNWLPWSWIELLIKNILKTSKKQHHL